MEWLTKNKIPVGKWAEGFFDWLQDNAAWFFDGMALGLEALIDGILWVISDGGRWRNLPKSLRARPVHLQHLIGSLDRALSSRRASWSILAPRFQGWSLICVLRRVTMSRKGKFSSLLMIERHGLVAPKGPAGSVVFFHGCTLHGSAPNMSPWNRTIVFWSPNRTDNKITAPTRPDFLALQDFDAVEPLADDCLLA